MISIFAASVSLLFSLQHLGDSFLWAAVSVINVLLIAFNFRIYNN